MPLNLVSLSSIRRTLSTARNAINAPGLQLGNTDFTPSGGGGADTGGEPGTGVPGSGAPPAPSQPAHPSNFFIRVRRYLMMFDLGTTLDIHTVAGDSQLASRAVTAFSSIVGKRKQIPEMPVPISGQSFINYLTSAGGDIVLDWILPIASLFNTMPITQALTTSLAEIQHRGGIESIVIPSDNNTYKVYYAALRAGSGAVPLSFTALSLPVIVAYKDKSGGAIYPPCPLIVGTNVMMVENKFYIVGGVWRPDAQVVDGIANLELDVLHQDASQSQQNPSSLPELVSMVKFAIPTLDLKNTYALYSPYADYVDQSGIYRGTVMSLVNINEGAVSEGGWGFVFAYSDSGHYRGAWWPLNRTDSYKLIDRKPEITLGSTKLFRTQSDNETDSAKEWLRQRDDGGLYRDPSKPVYTTLPYASRQVYITMVDIINRTDGTPPPEIRYEIPPFTESDLTYNRGF